MQRQVQQVVAPGAQAVQGVVEAEGEGAERTEGLVAAAVGEQGAPEVIVQDVDPRSLRKKVLVGLDGAAGGAEEINYCQLLYFQITFVGDKTLPCIVTHVLDAQHGLIWNVFHPPDAPLISEI